MNIDRKSFDDHWLSLFDSISSTLESSQKLSFRNKKNDDEILVRKIFKAN